MPNHDHGVYRCPKCYRLFRLEERMDGDDAFNDLFLTKEDATAATLADHVTELFCGKCADE